MDKILKTQSKLSILYFAFLIILGPYLMVNMTLVILKAKFTENQKIREAQPASAALNQKKDLDSEGGESFNLQELRLRKIWRRAKPNALHWTDNTRGVKKNSIYKIAPKASFSREISILTQESFSYSPSSQHLNFYARNKTQSLRRASTRFHAAKGRAGVSAKNSDLLFEENKHFLRKILDCLFSPFSAGKVMKPGRKNIPYLKANADHRQAYMSSSESVIINER